jgi:DegV family protein with EDD domain
LHFAEMLRAGALAVIREQESLNQINVFPVADADTGANLAATLKAAVARLGDDSPARIGDAARAAADAALDGARGNSGAIFAQFLHGLAAAVVGRLHVTTDEFAVAAHRGAEAAYLALQSPREGTILSVLRAWAHELGVHAATSDEFGDLLSKGLVGARAALLRTPRQLEVLARSHVVDAGGQGFVYFLEGISESLHAGHTMVRQAAGAAPRSQPAVASAAVGLPGSAPPMADHVPVDERLRYCSEALVLAAGQPLDRAAITAAVSELGESVVVAGDERRLRVHVHTNVPRRFLATVATHGHVERSKVDDMILQQLDARQATISLVADSTCDLPEQLAFTLGIVSVPLTISFGEQSFLDGVDLSIEGFSRRMATTKTLPTSSQPAVGDLRQTYERLLVSRQAVISVHIAAALSGTYQAAVLAARQVDDARIRVIDSRSVSVGAGLLLEALGAAIAGGASLDECVALAERVRAQITVFGAMPTLAHAVRGGRVSRRAAALLDGLHLRPLIEFDEFGAAGKGGVYGGYGRALDALARRAEDWAAGKPARVMVVHTGCLPEAERVADGLRRRLGVDDVPIVRGGAVVSSHVGPGSVSVAVRRLDS